jgi:hypothetical protein
LVAMRYCTSGVGTPGPDLHPRGACSLVLGTSGASWLARRLSELIGMIGAHVRFLTHAWLPALPSVPMLRPLRHAAVLPAGGAISRSEPPPIGGRFFLGGSCGTWKVGGGGGRLARSGLPPTCRAGESSWSSQARRLIARWPHSRCDTYPSAGWVTQYLRHCARRLPVETEPCL